jgi:chemotaxis protein MotB
MNPENLRSEGGGDANGEQAGKIDAAATSSTLASRREGAEFTSAEASLRQALQDLPEFAELSKHIIMDQTPEGLRIQLVDQEGRAMFEGSSAEPLPRTRQLLEAVAKVINALPNRISISGHTDASVPAGGGYTNWDLSINRANAARRVLEAQGIDDDRIYQIVGKAASEPLYPDDPEQPANRRISIVLLREAPVLPADHAL